jgi:GTPase
MEKETKNKHLVVTVATAITVLVAVMTWTRYTSQKISSIENSIDKIGYMMTDIQKLYPIVMNNQKDLITILTLHGLEYTK